MRIIPLAVGDIIRMKKAHPCGNADFRVLRIGSDIRIVCQKCGRDITVPREKLEKNIKSVQSVAKATGENHREPKGEPNG